MVAETNSSIEQNFLANSKSNNSRWNNMIAYNKQTVYLSAKILTEVIRIAYSH